MAESEPVNEEEALSDPKWICAMKEELESIEKNDLNLKSLLPEILCSISPIHVLLVRIRDNLTFNSIMEKCCPTHTRAPIPNDYEVDLITTFTILSFLELFISNEQKLCLISFL
ncbi:unnamed protein product [Vicia faba]|uniref:Uncharacterized protein n=1 Tax=Vicia faba TaxID=3906 RepID=A0AAV0YM75_VICFA|nr:unnamed protein product [Vicia faba]